MVKILVVDDGNQALKEAIKLAHSKSAVEAQPEPLNELLVCPRCGWTGSELKKNGCITDGDEWYECPRCNLVGSEMRRAN